MAARNNQSKSTSRSRSSARRGESSISRRARIVWAALLVTMTGVGGTLYALDGTVKPSMNGLALMASSASSNIASVFNTPTALGAWDRIVIIDSGSPFANAESLTSDALVRGESSGIGFHFVIGNGKSLENGRVYRCPRWEGQLGASRAYGADLSDGRTIVVCLVGNSERYRMTDAQGQGAVALVDVLIKKFHIAPERVEMRVGPGLNSAQFREAIGG